MHKLRCFIFTLLLLLPLLLLQIATWLLWFLGMAYLKSFTSLARDRCEALLSSPSSTLMQVGGGRMLLPLDSKAHHTSTAALVEDATPRRQPRQQVPCCVAQSRRLMLPLVPCLPARLPRLQHVRCLTLLLGILVNLVHWVASYLGGLDPRDSSRLGYAMLWLFDAIIIAVEAAHALTKYGVHAAERWRVLRAEERGEEGAEPWAGRGPFLYYLELATDLTLHTLTLAHYAHLWLLHGLRLSLTDAVLFLDVRHLAGGTWQRIRGHRRYLRLTHQLEHSFPCASAGALAEAECAICLSGFSAAGQVRPGCSGWLPTLLSASLRCLALLCTAPPLCSPDSHPATVLVVSFPPSCAERQGAALLPCLPPLLPPRLAPAEQVRLLQLPHVPGGPLPSAADAETPGPASRNWLRAAACISGVQAARGRQGLPGARARGAGRTPCSWLARGLPGQPLHCGRQPAARLEQQPGRQHQQPAGCHSAPRAARKPAAAHDPLAAGAAIWRGAGAGDAPRTGTTAAGCRAAPWQG